MCFMDVTFTQFTCITICIHNSIHAYASYVAAHLKIQFTSAGMFGDELKYNSKLCYPGAGCDQFVGFWSAVLQSSDVPNHLMNVIVICFDR